MKNDPAPGSAQILPGVSSISHVRPWFYPRLTKNHRIYTRGLILQMSARRYVYKAQETTNSHFSVTKTVKYGNLKTQISIHKLIHVW